MAFHPNNAAAAPSAVSTPTNDSWKAQGFINFYLPATNGTRRKIGAIALKASRSADKALLDLLADPDNVQKFMNKLEVDFQEANTDTGAIFDLG